MAADAYIKMHCIDLDIRFDIIDVVGDVGQFKITHIEDAFVSPIFS